MKNAKQMALYVFLASVLGILVTVVTWPLRGLFLGNTPLAETSMTYLSFFGWATYFLFGAAPKPAAKAYASIFFGILGAIVMYWSSYWTIWPVFSFDATFALPVGMGVFLGMLGLCYVEKVKWAGNVAASFVGCACYFSMIAAGVFPNAAATTVGEYAMAGFAELFYILIGFIAGWLTVKIDIFCCGWGVKKEN